MRSISSARPSPARHWRSRPIAPPPPECAAPSTRVVRALDGLILQTIAALDSAAVEDYPRIVAETDRALQPLMGRASGVIHGVERDDLMAAEPSQDTVDALMG